METVWMCESKPDTPHRIRGGEYQVYDYWLSGFVWPGPKPVTAATINRIKEKQSSKQTVLIN